MVKEFYYKLDDYAGFSLIELVLSLMILSLSIVVIFSGFDTSDKLNAYSAFESQAVFLAERELELLRADLLTRKRVVFPGHCYGRFKLKPGWKVKLAWTKPDKFNVVRLKTTALYKGDAVTLETFVFLPKQEVNKNTI